MSREIFYHLENPKDQNESEESLESEADIDSASVNTVEESEADRESESLSEQLAKEESTLLQRFRGKAKDIAKALIFMTALSASAEYLQPKAAFAQEEQKIAQQEKTLKQIKTEQAVTIAERLKTEYMRVNLLPDDHQILIAKHGSIEVASFWLAQSKAREIMDAIQEEQGIEKDNRTDVIGGEIFLGYTDHLQDIGRDMENWSVRELTGEIAKQFSSKFTAENMPRDEVKESAIRSLKEKGIDIAEENKFASGKQLHDILEMVEGIENQDPSSMKLESFTLERGGGGWARKNIIYLTSDVFNPDEIRERFKEYPEVQIKWIFTHEMGHLSFDGLTEQEQKQWRELQSEKDFTSMIENGFDGDHRYPEMFSYYFINRDDMIREIEGEPDGELKGKLIKQFNFIADKCKGESFEKSLQKRETKE